MLNSNSSANLQGDSNGNGATNDGSNNNGSDNGGYYGNVRGASSVLHRRDMPGDSNEWADIKLGRTRRINIENYAREDPAQMIMFPPDQCLLQQGSGKLTSDSGETRTKLLSEAVGKLSRACDMIRSKLEDENSKNRGSKQVVEEKEEKKDGEERGENLEREESSMQKCEKNPKHTIKGNRQFSSNARSCQQSMQESNHMTMPHCLVSLSV